MTEHDVQTLIALRRQERRYVDGADLEYSDITIMVSGDALFGEGWTMRREGRRYIYAPLVSMSLGRLRREGLVRRGRGAGSVGNYHRWALTEEGRRESDRLLGRDDDLG